MREEGFPWWLMLHPSFPRENFLFPWYHYLCLLQVKPDSVHEFVRVVLSIDPGWSLIGFGCSRDLTEYVNKLRLAGFWFHHWMKGVGPFLVIFLSVSLMESILNLNAGWIEACGRLPWAKKQSRVSLLLWQAYTGRENRETGWSFIGGKSNRWQPQMQRLRS